VITVLATNEKAILTYLAEGADVTDCVSLRGMLGEDKAGLPREEFGRGDWERLTDLYFAVRNLLMLGLVDGIAADGGEHLNRFRITDKGRAVFAAGDGRELP
jgi:hypothetical protein